ncbi:Gfo/Idh/MocA family oxidoreductase [Halomicroarcula limicola]|uniref:Gfo/Idh/MocA family oxidoreductase n=1 Tax=Haloarcula limicola TaxID=1429915 RepID=A0A8J8C4D0_9EURY|nr:Gfo/Idh/MocA family oxidoreductase [Halomicroarcula limicola]MBV0925197.1 Gfo/Idh/MocA family oxidoreductase [Halomicroarcula limicola]
MTIRAGIVGAGDIALDRHLPTYRDTSGVTVSGVYDRNPDTLGMAVETHGVTPVHSLTDLHSISDLIVICTPPWAHHDIAVDALSAGCDVLTEKPLAVTVDQADNMIATANDTGQSLSVVNNFLYLDSVQRAKRLIRAGAYGSVMKMHALQFRQFDHDSHSPDWFEKLPGGMFWDESPHMMYLLREFLGDLSVESVRTEPRDGPKQEHNIYARFTGQADTAGKLVMDFDSPITEWWLLLFCEEGLLCVDLFRDVLVQLTKEADHSASRVLSVLLNTVWQLTAGTVVSGTNRVRERVLHGYRVPDAGLSRQVASVIDALEANQQPPASPIDGRSDLEIMANIVSAGDL